MRTIHELHDKSKDQYIIGEFWVKRGKNKILNLLVYVSANSGRILNGWDG